jgi:hypothetical protein
MRTVDHAAAIAWSLRARSLVVVLVLMLTLVLGLLQLLC